jgi:hypothetical protein
MPASEYKPIQREYLSWITVRLKAGVSLDAMNAELKAANLFLESPSNPNDADAILNSHAGYLAEIETQPTEASHHVIAIRFGTYTGSGCNEDETVALYRREPLHLLTTINAESSYTHGYILRDVALGKENAEGRLIALPGSLPTARATGTAISFESTALAQARSKLSLTRMSRRSSTTNCGSALREAVTFRYSSGISDIDVIVRTAIARYEVQGQATRVAPIAPSYGGFIDEWLNLDDAEAARWSSPTASALRHEVSARLTQEFFIFRGAWNCAAAREIEVESNESKKLSVFRISGSTTEQMRMEAVFDRPSPGCREIDIKRDLTAVLNEPR